VRSAGACRCGSIPRVLLLVPSDPLRPRRPDDHFAAEAEAAREAGWSVACIDHDALTRSGDAAEAVARVSGEGLAVYRGWMLRSEQYCAFGTALAAKGVTLRTVPEQYQRAHELPGWYAAFVAVTPPSVWTSGDDMEAFDEQRRQLGAGSGVLRDYSPHSTTPAHRRLGATSMIQVARTPEMRWIPHPILDEPRSDYGPPACAEANALSRIDRFGVAGITAALSRNRRGRGAPHRHVPQAKGVRSLNSGTPLLSLRTPFGCGRRRRGRSPRRSSR